MPKRSYFNQEVADRICKLVAEGRSLASCAQEKGIPSRTVIYEWLKENPNFADDYARAREVRADFHADEIIDIADTCEDANIGRLRVDARKWVASKLNSKKYGDRATVAGDPEAPLKVEHEHAVSPGLEKVLGLLAGIAEREQTE